MLTDSQKWPVLAGTVFILYSVGLKLAGLDWSLAIGMLAGLVSFVSYLGVIFGMLTASIAVLIQSQEVMQLIWVLR